MDAHELERIGADNPAQSVPAAQRVPVDRRRSNGSTKPAAKRSEYMQKGETSTSDLTKYDVRVELISFDGKIFELTTSRLVGAG